MTTQLIEMREALRQAMDEEMACDSRVFIIGEEVAEYNGAYKVTKGMLAKWSPERVIDTPISEEGFAGLTIRAAMMGLRPIVFRGPNGAAAQVSSQHSHRVEAIYSNLPGLIVIAPSNP